MAKKKAPAFICKYCNAKTPNKDELCAHCKAKKKLMQGWHWVYVGKSKDTLKIK